MEDQHIPVNVVLIIDRSDSMSEPFNGHTRLDFAKTDVQAFIFIMKAGDGVGVIDFNDMAKYTYRHGSRAKSLLDNLGSI